MSEDLQKTLKKFIQRRHPEYKKMLPHWEFVHSAYEGGRDWFDTNVFRYFKEGDGEYGDRIKRAYRFNHTREVVDLIVKYIFKMDISRSEEAPEQIKKFWSCVTRNGMDIRDFMKHISTKTSIYGRIWVAVDNDAPAQPISKAEEGNFKVYAYTIDPPNALDMSYDDEEKLNWFLVHEQERDDADPLTSSGAMIDRYRLWTREDYRTFTIVPKGSAATATQIDPTGAAGSVIDLARQVREGNVGELGAITVDTDDGYAIEVSAKIPHTFGAVPIFPADHLISRELYRSPSMVDDIAYLDRAVANYLSNLDAIIQDQTFSQLVIPAQGMEPGTEGGGANQLVEMGTKRIFSFDAEAGMAPTFISPDVKQAQLILSVIAKIINEIYHTAGLAGERTKEDNSQGIDNSSGVAKAYDFERVNSMLAAKADSLELIEQRLIEHVSEWLGLTLPENDDKRLVLYPDNFDVRGLYDEFEIAARLSLVEAPDTVRRHQMEQLVKKLFPQLKTDLLEKIRGELTSWPPEPELPVAAAPGGANPAERKGAESNSKKAMNEASNNSLANKLVNA